MPEFHAEPYVHLAGLSPTSAFIAWGAFYFRVRSSGRWKLVDDRDLARVHPPRRDSIGVRSAPYGRARVNVFDAAGALVATRDDRNDQLVPCHRPAPDTTTPTRCIVNDEVWAEGERYDWQPGAEQGLVQSGGRYVNGSAPIPLQTNRSDGPLTFAIIGDFGVGIARAVRPSGSARSARRCRWRSTSTMCASCSTTGDNIYAGKRLLGLPIGDHGDEDDDWFFTFYQPYRYLLNRIPDLPVHRQPRYRRDRGPRRPRRRCSTICSCASGWRQTKRRARRRSILACFIACVSARDVEFICIDTSKETFFSRGRLFEHPEHQAFLEESLRRSKRTTGCDGGFRFVITLRIVRDRAITTPAICSRSCAGSATPACARCSAGTSTTSSTRASTASNTS